MPTTLRPSGITVETHGATAVRPAVPLRRRRLGQLAPDRDAPSRRRRSPQASIAPMTEQEAIVDSLEAQQLDLVDAVPLIAPAPEPAPPGRRRRANEARTAPATSDRVDLTVPLGANESAVVLIERDGVYTWQIAGVEGAAPLPPQGSPRRRRGNTGETGEATAPMRTMRFTVTVAAEPSEPPAPRRASRSRRRSDLLTSMVPGRVVAYVFRFVAGPMLGGAARFLERNVREGLVHITQADPHSWETLGDDATVSVPTGRPARVLLLVHGTFSSTIGSFGALAGQPDGRAFLDAALRQYDLVVGWDHRTLSVLPTDNAVDLATRLERLGFSEPPEIDAIAFSRGGLVLRSLIEHVLPSSPQLLTMRRAVFVACANGGTELARPENWHRFVDRYTNLAAAGARIAAVVPGFTSSATILASSIRGVGAFVKIMATSAMTGDAVPGISAMNPGGDFVRDINGVQAGQPQPHETYYCAITSDFDPDTARTKADPEVMPPPLLLALTDKLTDTLCGKPNDLVVHVDAMTQIDEATGPYVRDRLDFGANGLVHHCCYFSQPRTATRLAAWLDVHAGDSNGSSSTEAATSDPRPASAGQRRGARMATAPSDVVTLRSTLPVTEALSRLERSSATWVVVERPYTDNGVPVTLHYAHPARLGLSWLRSWTARPDATVHDAFELRETRRSPTAPVGSGATPGALEPGQSPAILEYHHGSQYRTVLLDRGQPVGVLAPREDLQGVTSRHADPGSELESLQFEATPGPSAGGGRPPGMRRRFRNAGSRSPAPSVRRAPVPRAPVPAPTATASAGTVAVHFRAETDDEYVVQQVHTVAVTIAREALEATAGRTSAGGSAKVKASKPLVVECMPMLRVSLADPDDARVQIPVPDAGIPAEIRFDLVGNEAGPGEVRVQVRQGPLPLVTLTLPLTIVASRTGARRPVRAEADLEEMPSTFPRATDELRIIETQPGGNATQYRFELRLPSKRIQKHFVSELLDTDPSTYVAALHTRIEDRWAQYRSEKDAFARDLRAIGAEMFDALFPLELRQLLWQHRDAIGSVQVLSSEPFVPWELVHLRDPASHRAGPGSAFLGELGVVRWLVNGYPPERLRVRAGKARYVVPDYPSPNELPGAEDEIALVTERFGATGVEPEAEAIYRLVETPGQFDLLHIACHGLADATDIGSARLEMPGKRRTDGSMSEEHVLAKTVGRDADLADGEFQPIVVLNACQSARGGYSLKGIGGFAQAFVERGAGVFIGSSWSVGDEPALSFIEEFYARFLSTSKPEPLARASAAARQKARADGDATWLAYVVYGHPRAVARVT